MLQCRNPTKPDPCWPQGDYWFCSAKCYKEAYGKYLDKEYGFDKTPEDSDEAKAFWNEDEPEYNEQRKRDERRIIAIHERWYERKKVALHKAKTELYERIIAEAARLGTEQAEKERIVREKEQEKLEKERVEREAHLERLKPRPIPEKIRLEHTHILGTMSGQGKRHSFKTIYSMIFRLTFHRPISSLTRKGSWSND